jgi:DNA-binding transcriptional LysR family regulator
MCIDRIFSGVSPVKVFFSVKIRRLEERLSIQIFNRTRKSLSLTLEGEILLDVAGRILSVDDEAVSRLTKPKTSGNLRIG